MLKTLSQSIKSNWKRTLSGLLAVISLEDAAAAVGQVVGDAGNNVWQINEDALLIHPAGLSQLAAFPGSYTAAAVNGSRSWGCSLPPLLPQRERPPEQPAAPLSTQLLAISRSISLGLPARPG